MDKNFINIDDLVRQRLAGGEEQERSGAWLRMRDLLDQEMPKKRVGMIYWRRMFGAVAVLLLVSMITVGGYEIAASRKAQNGTGDGVVASVASAPAATASVNDTKEPGEVGPSISSSVADAGDNNTPGNTNNKQNNHRKLAVAATEKATAAGDDNTSARKTVANKETLAANDKNSKQLNDNNGNKTAAVTKETSQDAAFAKTGNKQDAAKENVAGKEGVADKISSKEVVKTGANKTTVAGNDKPAVAKTTMAKTAGKEVAAKSSVAGTKTTGPKDVKVTTNKVAAVSKDVKTTSNKVAAVSKDAKASGHTVTSAVKEEKVAALPLGSGTAAANNNKVAAKTIPVSAGLEKAAGTKVAVVAGAKPAGNKKAEAVAAINTKVTAPVAPAAGAAKTAAPVVAAKPAVANTPVKEVAVLNVKKGKKVVQKLTLLERYVKITPTEGYYHIDTISMEEFTEENGLTSENKPYLPKSKKSALASVGNESNDLSSAANPQILPGATASANGKPAMGAKENAVAGKSSSGSGTSVLQNLSAAFNDIKIQASGMKFAMGLTGGINGTFFGPTSFKGFQFGVTGDFVFGTAWSIATAVEYFHRINGNYAMYDNYYNYTPAAGGYSRQQESESYSFSTIHSIEMPIAARYTNGNFNFFIGTNLVYNFAINTDGAPQLPVGNPQLVTNQSNDNHPTLKAADFNSKFGVGCLFGLSYQVSPKVNVDLRNVLTLWNSASTPGAKYVSDQLYKNPSIQLSLGYRFGGAKK